MRYILYCKKHDTYPTASLPLPHGYTFTEIKPSFVELIKKQVTACEFLWGMMALGRVTIVIVRDNGGVLAHRSTVIGRNFKFPFLRRGECEIGPCLTVPAYRGKKIYPAVLCYITNTHPQDFLMLVREDNMSSIKGIERAGFTAIGEVKKEKGRWKKM
ncbi:MAG: hypothetical protein VB055_01970 [Oscillospiraceae bacterium]|nr:hypothetical protein [Oscillospiraceae bacterium]